jgi:hypothetical protein
MSSINIDDDSYNDNHNNSLSREPDNVPYGDENNLDD